MEKISIFWFRRDLRLHDNAALFYALKDAHPVLPVFIFDKEILDKLSNKKDRRVEFIRNALVEIQQDLSKENIGMRVLYATPVEAFTFLIDRYDVQKVFTNHDYERYALERDDAIKKLLAGRNISFNTYKDQVIFEKDEVMKDDGKPYTVYTPYSRRWKELLNEFYIKAYPVEKYFSNFYKQNTMPVPSLASMGFQETEKPFPAKSPSEVIIQSYDATRDFPALTGTSRLGIHLRFGTVSVRDVVKQAMKFNAVFLNELIWREFYMAIEWHFPHVGQHKSFKPEYDRIAWRNNEEEFDKWCNGQTGYPIVDAGMRELNETGYMHNRVRMITGSFLCKDLLIDWKWGEAYFAEKLLDYEFASNNGGWQWVAGSGCDAVPYFRIFNPVLQTEKFDKDLKYIKKWVPEFQEFTYPAPMVDHKMARARCLAAYKAALATQ